VIEQFHRVRPTARDRALAWGMVAALLLLIALPAAVRAGNSPNDDIAAAWPSNPGYANLSSGAAAVAHRPTSDPDALPQTDLEEPKAPLPGSFSVLVLLAVATTAIFLVAVAYDSRRRDASPLI